MPRVKTTPMVRFALGSLSIYLVALLGLLLVRFIRGL
jgi:ABC-type phosphate transport system auxiliary subunit